MKLAEQILQITEVIWHELYPAAKAMKRFPNDYIHFTGIEKIGINPKKTHRDPHGVYFYPCKWLLDPDNLAGFQYGLAKEFFYIARVNLKGEGVVNLSKITLDQAFDLASQNGWGSLLVRASNRTKEFFKDSPIPKGARRRPGALFYGVADMLVNSPDELHQILDTPYKLREEVWTWGKLFKGINVLVDRGHGIIASKEASQVVVINPKYYKVLYKGSNTPKYDSAEIETGRVALKMLNGEEVRIEKGLLVGRFDFEGAPVTVKFNTGNFRSILNFYKNKRRVEHVLRMESGFDVPREYEARNAVSYIKRYLSSIKPEPEPEGGDTSEWSTEEFSKLAERIMYNYREARRGVSEDGTQWITSDRGGLWGGHFNYQISLSITPNGLLTLDYQDWTEGHDFDYKKEDVHKNEVEEVLKDFYLKFSRYIEGKYGDNDAWKRLVSGENGVEGSRDEALWTYSKFMGINWPS